MTDSAKAALGSAAIIALGLYLSAQALAEPQFRIVTVANGGVAWRLDTRNGSVSFCSVGLGCQPVEKAEAARTKTGDWLDTWNESQAENSN